jgi:hypothetical protein
MKTLTHDQQNTLLDLLERAYFELCDLDSDEVELEKEIADFLQVLSDNGTVERVNDGACVSLANDNQ